MLDTVVWGNTIQNWGISILIIIGTIIVTKLVSLFNRRVLKKLTKKTRNRLDDILYDSLESPLLFGIVLLGIWIAIHRLVYPDRFVKAVDDAYRILIVLDITWFAAKLIMRLIETYWEAPVRAQTGHRQVGKMMPVIKRTTLVLIWIIGIIMALSNVGVNISALLGTLGIGGIAFALAAQDTVKNIFGAFTILTDKPFFIGDTIQIDSFEGAIVDVGVRSTKMMNYDNRIITIPNYRIADASIVNVSSEPRRRVVMKIGLTYDTTAEKMNEAMEMLRNMPSRVKDVASDGIIANFSDFLDSAMVITFIYFIEKGGDIGRTSSNVNMEILSSFDKAGLNFAFPSQTLYIEKTDALKENAEKPEDDSKNKPKPNN